MAATLDREDSEYRIGDELPALWHWLHFLPIHRLSDSGYDGHAALGGFLPPVPLPRRMWAGSRLTFHAPLQIGRTLTKRSEVIRVTHKKGSNGDLVFVTVSHNIFDENLLCTSEEQDIVYRAMPNEGAPEKTPAIAPTQCAFERVIAPDPVLLFRYSALTFNGHRIHYDNPFCTSTEGYGGLVVHGPLLATLMVDLLRRQFPEAHLENFAFRAISPIFDTHPFSVHVDLNPEGTYHLWGRRYDGALAMDGTATLKAFK